MLRIYWPNVESRCRTKRSAAGAFESARSMRIGYVNGRIQATISGLSMKSLFGSTDRNVLATSTACKKLSAIPNRNILHVIQDAALLAGTPMGVFWLVGTPVIGTVPVGLPGFQLELPTAVFLVAAIEPAIILALLGSVDSLLISLVADSLTGTRHHPNRELVGQGLGNIIAGLPGGLPGAGSTTGTVTNIRAGGSTPVSGALYGLFMLALVLGLGRYVEPIPLAVLAGILMKVGLDYHRLAPTQARSSNPARPPARHAHHVGANGVR